MYKTKDKIYIVTKVLNEQKRAKKSTKRKLKASEEKCSWSQVLLKTECFWSDDVIRSCLIGSYISPEAQVRQNSQNLKLQELFHDSKFMTHRIWSFKSCFMTQSSSKTRGIMQRSFQKDLKTFGWKNTKSVNKSTLYELYNHLLHYSVLCLCYKTR